MIIISKNTIFTEVVVKKSYSVLRLLKYSMIIMFLFYWLQLGRQEKYEMLNVIEFTRYDLRVSD